MKRIYFIIALVLFSFVIHSQELAVQGIARDENGTARINQNIALTFELYYLEAASNTPSSVYTTTTSLGTDNFGVFSTTLDLSVQLESLISNKDTYLKISEGNNIISNEKLKSVPYAISSRNGAPTGSIMVYMGQTAPQGWLLCNGGTIPIDNSTQALRDLLGNTNTPNLQGMFLRGTGTSSVNNQSGPALGETQEDELEAHNHLAGRLVTEQAGEHDHGIIRGRREGVSSSGNLGVVDFSTGGSDRTTTNGNHMHTITGETANAGGLETRPVNFGVNYIIKL
jgi:microcystin-dependent protein